MNRLVGIASAIVAFAITSVGCGDSDAVGGGAAAGGSGGIGGTGGGGGASELPAGYECLGTVELQTPTAATADFSFRLNGIPQTEVGAGVTVDVCAKDDEGCASPLATQTTDSQGEATLPLPMGPHGFEGYAQMTGASIKSQIVVGAVPLIPDPKQSYLFPIYDNNAFDGLYQQLFGVTANPSKGQLLLNLANCDGAPAEGVAISVDAAESVAYGINGVPAPELTASSAEGSAFALNVTPGMVTISGTLAGRGDVYASASALVRADTLTIVYMQPTP